MFPLHRQHSADVRLLRRSSAVVVEREGRKRQAKTKEKQCGSGQSTLKIFYNCLFQIYNDL
jgi:hypothetical protein